MKKIVLTLILGVNAVFALNGKINTESVACRTKDAFSEMNRASVDKDEETFGSLIYSGQCRIFKSGTSIFSIDYGILGRSSFKHRSITWYISSEFIQSI